MLLYCPNLHCEVLTSKNVSKKYLPIGQNKNSLSLLTFINKKGGELYEKSTLRFSWRIYASCFSW